eukprot:5376647-Pyramimonas_sp.AAC.1
MVVQLYSGVFAYSCAAAAVLVETGSDDSDTLSLPLFLYAMPEVLLPSCLRDCEELCEELIPCAATLTDLRDSGACRTSVRSLGFA